jgi:hypothetical protein
MLSKAVDELVAKVNIWAACGEVMLNELFEVLETVPIKCCIPPFDGSSGFPEPCMPDVT